MEFILEPWHWFVLGVALILFELILPSFAALWFGVSGHFGRHFILDFSFNGL